MKLETGSFQFTQGGDSMTLSPVNELDVEITDAGGGPYIVIKTERWALNPEELQGFVNELMRCIHTVERHEPLVTDDGAKAAAVIDFPLENP